MKKIFALILSTSVFFSEISFAQNTNMPSDHSVPSTKEIKSLLTDGLMFVGYCQTFDELIDNHPNGKYKNFAPFANEIKYKNAGKYAACLQMKMLTDSSMFEVWKTENEELYYLGFATGLCELHSDVNSISGEDKESRKFVSETNKYFKDVLYKLRESMITANNDMLKKYSIARHGEAKKQCEEYKEKYYEVDLNIDEIVHEIITNKLLFKAY
jgi:hypothetical protein